MPDQDCLGQVPPLLENSQAAEILPEEFRAQVAKDEEYKFWGQLHHLGPRGSLAGESATSAQHNGWLNLMIWERE
jgi:hypothetical protein